MMKAFLLLFLSTNLFAIDNDTDGYRYKQYDYAKHDLHGDCKFVESRSAVDLYVPTKTSAEWTAFFTNGYTGITRQNCHTGASYSGSYTLTGQTQKFYMGDDFQTCDEVCADKGGCVAAGFAQITTNVICREVVEGIIGSVPTYTTAGSEAIDSSTDPDTNINSPSTTLGCTFFDSIGYKVAATQVRYFNTTTPTCNAMTTTEGYQRVCPCAN